MNPYIQRALLLMEQNRYPDARTELQRALSQDPDNAMVFALMGECLIQEDQGAEAVEMAKRALQLDADKAYYKSILSKAYMVQKQYKSALQYIEEAIGADPYEDNFHFLKGNILYLQKQWQGALDSAEQALRLNPESVVAINLRSMALVKLNRKAEAIATADYALNRAPEDTYSHSNKGWAELENGDHQKAQNHFREALRFNPMNESARVGLKESIKADNIIYRQILNYFLWIAKLSERNQWAFIIGLYVIYRGILWVGENYPSLTPVTYPLILAYIVFAFSTWIALPVSNFFLRLHPLGKHALTNDEKLASNLVSGSLILSILFLAVYFITGAFFFVLIGGWFGFMALPLGPLFSADKGTKGRKILIGLTSLIGLVGLGAIFIDPGMALFFFFGIFAYGFVANSIAMKA